MCCTCGGNADPAMHFAASLSKVVGSRNINRSKLCRDVDTASRWIDKFHLHSPCGRVAE